jgi:hypothetical protein
MTPIERVVIYFKTKNGKIVKTDLNPPGTAEKWLNRIVTVALALYNLVQYLLTHWASAPK